MHCRRYYYLTLGYFLGGKWADRRPEPQFFYTILLWGAFSAGIVPMVARPVLQAAATAFDQLQIGVLMGAFTAVLVLLIVPITLARWTMGDARTCLVLTPAFLSQDESNFKD